LTEKLYDKDAYLSEFTAMVLDCISVDGGYDVILDRTAFFPEGGGQYGDAGGMDGIPVTDTQIREGTVLHRTPEPLSPGKTVSCFLNWEERFRRMQNHSGEHIVSGIVHTRFGYENVGFHLSDGEMTMDYSGELTEADLLSVEREANRAVVENRRILCRYPDPEELKTLQYRSKKELNEAVRIVTVEELDTCACCAPHVRNTGEIGGIYILSSMRWKGGTRITVRCGRDAYEEYCSLRQDERELSRLFSAPRGQIFPAAERLQKDYTDLRRQYNLVLKENALLKLSSQSSVSGNLCFLSPSPEADVMRAVANEGCKKCTGLFVCLSGTDGVGYRYVISSSVPGLRGRAREINAALSGRGGGSDPMIQGSFSAPIQTIQDYFKEFTI